MKNVTIRDATFITSDPVMKSVLRQDNLEIQEDPRWNVHKEQQKELIRL